MLQEIPLKIISVLNNLSQLTSNPLGLNPSEIRTRLLAKSVKIQEYEIIKYLSEMRSQGLVRIERNRWYVTAQVPVETLSTSGDQPRDIGTWRPSTSIIIDPTKKNIKGLGGLSEN
jgi:hypothetical protein